MEAHGDFHHIMRRNCWEGNATGRTTPFRSKLPSASPQASFGPPFGSGTGARRYCRTSTIAKPISAPTMRLATTTDPSANPATHEKFRCHFQMLPSWRMTSRAYVRPSWHWPTSSVVAACPGRAGNCREDWVARLPPSGNCDHGQLGFRDRFTGVLPGAARAEVEVARLGSNVRLEQAAHRHNLHRLLLSRVDDGHPAIIAVEIAVHADGAQGGKQERRYDDDDNFGPGQPSLLHAMMSFRRRNGITAEISRQGVSYHKVRNAQRCAIAPHPTANTTFDIIRPATCVSFQTKRRVTIWNGRRDSSISCPSTRTCS